MQAATTLNNLPQLLPLAFNPHATPMNLVKQQKSPPRPRRPRSPPQHIETVDLSPPPTPSAALPVEAHPMPISSHSTQQQEPQASSRSTPDLPPVDIPLPLNLSKKLSAAAPNTSRTSTRADTQAHTRSSSGTSYVSASSGRRPRTGSSGASGGPMKYQKMQEPSTNPLHTERYAHRPLPATPETCKPAPMVPVRAQGRAVSFGNPVVGQVQAPPSPPLSPDAAFVASVDATSMDAAPLGSQLTEDQPPTASVHDTQADPKKHDVDSALSKQIRNLPQHIRQSIARASMIVVAPEQTAWQRTAYIPGAIKIQKPGTIANSPLSPIESYSSGFSNAADAAWDPRKSLADFIFDDDATSPRHRRCEETILAEVAQYIETFGFDPVAFDGDEFWLGEREDLRVAQRKFSRPTSTTSAEVPFFLHANAPSGGGSGSASNLYGGPTTPQRLSHGDHRPSSHGRGSVDRSSGSSAGYPHNGSFHSGSTGYGLSPTSSLGTPRHLPPSPASPHGLGRPDSMTEKERKAALKKMGGGGGSSSSKVGFLRLLRGASGIV